MYIAMMLFMDIYIYIIDFSLPEASLQVLIVRCTLSGVSLGVCNRVVSIGLASYILGEQHPCAYVHMKKQQGRRYL